MYPHKLEIKDMKEGNTSASYLDLLLSISRDGLLHTSIYDKLDDFNITNISLLCNNIPSLPTNGVVISKLIRYARDCSSYVCGASFEKAFWTGLCQGTFEIVFMEVLWSALGSYHTISQTKIFGHKSCKTHVEMIFKS